MRKLNLKLSIITNTVLVIVLVCVCVVSFNAGKVSPIYSNNTISAIYNGNRNNKKISLMFNVYEGAGIVNSIIKVLEEYDAKATFFVGGCWADDNEETLQKIVKSGNEIANHGYFHKDHKKLSLEKNKEEILSTERVIQGLCGVKTNLFAPPSGSFSDNTLKASDQLGYKTIMWSKDTIDWRDKDVDKIFNRATKNATNGDLILMHPKAHTLLALPRILEYYKSVGFSVVTVSDNLLE